MQPELLEHNKSHSGDLPSFSGDVTVGKSALPCIRFPSPFKQCPSPMRLNVSLKIIQLVFQ